MRMIPWEEKHFYYALLSILANTLDSFLGGFAPLFMAAIFTTAVGYNAIAFALLTQSGNRFACGFMIVASVVVTSVGYEILKFSEVSESLSESLMKDLQKGAIVIIRGKIDFRRAAGPSSRARSDCHRWNRYLERNFRRMPLRLMVRPFGWVMKGHCLTWLQQIIENTVTAIFMVTLGDNRLFF